MEVQAKIPSYLLRRYKWSNIATIFVWHVLAIAAYHHLFLHPMKVKTLVFGVIISISGGIGILVGAHRLWAHCAFKCGLGLKIFLMLAHSTTMNGPAYSYARDHRQHHKFSDTDKDPKNPNRGLFYSHLGWWCYEKDEEVLQAGRKLHFTDLYSCPVLMFEKRHYVALFATLGVILPTLIPYLFFDESLMTAFYVCVVMRVTIILHHFFTVNSLAHFFGYRPYDFRIRPRENRLVQWLSLGEGNHNFHHVFPQDYKSSPSQAWEHFNLATLVLTIFYYLGLIYDLKEASPELIRKTIENRGKASEIQVDRDRSLLYRIAFGVFDYVCGFAAILWFLYPVIGFKFLTGRAVFV